MVKSFSSSKPHLVMAKNTGQYSCDSHCPNWRSLKICSHSVAAAEFNGELKKFVAFVSKCNPRPNISKLATTHMPVGRGRKGGVAPSKKKKKVKASSRTSFADVLNNDYDPLEGTSSDHLLPAEENIPADSHYLLSRSETCVGFGYAQVTGPHGGFITHIAEPYPANTDLCLPLPLISYSSPSHPSIQIPSSLSQPSIRILPPSIPQPSVPSTPQPSVHSLSLQFLHCHLQHHSLQSLHCHLQHHSPQAYSTPAHLFFYFLNGNIRVCRGCRQKYVRPLLPPHDICIKHQEWQEFTPVRCSQPITRYGNVYYHCNVSCVQARCPYFEPHMLHITPNILMQLMPSHTKLLTEKKLLFKLLDYYHCACAALTR